MENPLVLKDYMVEKNRKLKEQFAAAARVGSTGTVTYRHRVEGDIAVPWLQPNMDHGFAEKSTPSCFAEDEDDYESST